MGYDLYITRAEHWTDSEASPITVAEWCTLVKQDDDLTITGMQGEYFAVWNGESEFEEPWLDWHAGRIFTKNPDEPLIEKMIAIAERLNARVQGDDGEIYLPGGQIAPATAQSGDDLNTALKSKLPWLKRFLGS
jgi:hypothetical protein